MNKQEGSASGANPPELRAKVVAAYLSRPEGTTGAQIAQQFNLANPSWPEKWTFNARQMNKALPRADPGRSAGGKRGGKAKKPRQRYTDDFKRAAVAASKKTKKTNPATGEGPERRGRFSDDFKRRAIAAYNSRKPGQGAAQILADMGVSSSPSLLYSWLKNPRLANGGTTALVDSRQQDFFDVPRLIEQANPGAASKAEDRVITQLAKAREQIATLTEDNAILRGIATLAFKRGLLDLFSFNVSKGG